MCHLLYAVLLGVFLGPFLSLAHLQGRDNSSLSLARRNDSAPLCDCYVVSGPEPGYFQYHRFYDFRSVPLDDVYIEEQQDHERRKQDRKDMTARRSQGHHPSLDGHAFSEEWDIQSWNRASSGMFPVTIVNSFDNIYITKANTTDDSNNSTHLVLRSTRYENHTSTAEVQTSTENVLHCSFRARFRLYSVANDSSNEITPPPSGAVAGMFTYYSQTNESDIEVLTSDPPNRMRYSNQPDWDPVADEMIPGASHEVDVSVPWTEWATHRLDWFPDQSRWYHENDLKLEMEYGVPSFPSVLILNLWSDGGPWSGNMSVGESVYMGIEWIEVAFNTSMESSENIEKSRNVKPSPGNRWGDRFERGKKANVVHPRHTPSPEDDRDHDADYEPDPDHDDDLNHDPWDAEYEDAHLRQGNCAVVCRIDDVETVGVPEVV